jgi:hypothetical protein
MVYIRSQMPNIDGVTLRFWALTAVCWYLMSKASTSIHDTAVKTAYIEKSMDDAVKHGLLR